MHSFEIGFQNDIPRISDSPVCTFRELSVCSFLDFVSLYNLQQCVRASVRQFWFHLQLLLTSVFKTNGIRQLTTLV